MTSINMADTTKLCILTAQILDMLKNNGYQQVKLNPDNTIFFNDNTTYYTLFIEQECTQDAIFIQIHARFADNYNHLTHTRILEILNKINSSIKGIKLSWDSCASKINISTETWLTTINGFRTYFIPAMGSFRVAMALLAKETHPELFPF